MLKIYNSLTKQKEEFKPIEEGKIKLYVCGMTVYDYCHIGHARVMIAFDMVVRLLKWKGYDVTYVKNITDIDDKIINRANEKKQPFEELTKQFINAMHEDEEALQILAPDIEPTATSHMPEIINMVSTLIEKGSAYEVNGDVYFDVSTFESYGKLSNRNLDELKSGARVEVTTIKRHPGDFALWKSAKPNEPSWNSPWGEGRPGWHIECSAMSTKCLGSHFDIHGGGMDLLFPHHENEIAQSEASTGEKFVNTWMHLGFIQVDKEKMSKSLDNFFTIREVLEKYHPEVIRLFMLTTHYRQPLNYSDAALDQAKSTLDGLYFALRDLDVTEGKLLPQYIERFDQALLDDFNTPEMFVVIFELIKAVNGAKETDTADIGDLAFTLHHLANALGLLQSAVEDYLKSGAALPEDEINALITKRTEARKNKDWKASDDIRDQLLEKGIVLDDTAGGTTWRKS
jgi:cysteinyl-tRNA synthetase